MLDSMTGLEQKLATDEGRGSRDNQIDNLVRFAFSHISTVNKSPRKVENCMVLDLSSAHSKLTLPFEVARSASYSLKQRFAMQLHIGLKKYSSMVTIKITFSLAYYRILDFHT